MAFNLRNRNFLKLLDFTPKEIKYMLDLAADLKKAKYAGTEQPRLKGKNIALIFEKTSTRTRCAFEVAAYDQGAHVTYLGKYTQLIVGKFLLELKYASAVFLLYGGISLSEGWLVDILLQLVADVELCSQS